MFLKIASISRFHFRNFRFWKLLSSVKIEISRSKIRTYYYTEEILGIVTVGSLYFIRKNAEN